jgi:uncharacterized protein YkwD
LKTMITSIFAGALLASSAVSTESQPAGCANSSIAAVEVQIVDEINAYRVQHGLAAVPRSRLLTTVAVAHVRDLETNHPDQAPCNTHSWSANGPWAAVSYTPDHLQARRMWDKPREITHGAYAGNGYEIAMRSSGPFTAQTAVDGWKHSPFHNAVILQQDIWRDADWHAMGVGVSDHYAVVWFGKEPDSGH